MSWVTFGKIFLYELFFFFVSFYTILGVRLFMTAFLS